MKIVGHCLKWAKIFRDAFHWWLRLDFEMETFQYKTISDGGITVDFWFIKVHTSN